MLAMVASSEEFGTFNFSVSGLFSGMTTGPNNYSDMFSGTSEETGSVEYTSPIAGSGSASGMGSGTGEDTCSPYGFEFAGAGAAIENNGVLQRIDGNTTSFGYTFIGANCESGGGSLYEIDLEGTFSTETFKASLSGETTSGAFDSSVQWSGQVAFEGGQTDGQIVSATFDGETLVYEYAIAGQPVKTATRTQGVGVVQAYWANESMTLSPVHDGVPFHWNTRGGAISVSDLGEIPAEANQILIAFDAGGDVAEGDEDNNQFLVPIGITIDSVEALFDEDGAADVFGAFLPGVRLENAFTVTIGEGAELVKEVKVEVAGIDPAPTVMKKSGSDTQWEFTLDVGKLTSDADIKITAMAEGGLAGEFTGRLKFADKLDLEVKVNATLDSENVRVIDTIDHQNFTFSGMLDSVPFSSHPNKPYQNRLNLYLIEGETEHLLSASFLDDSAGIFDVDALGPGEHTIRAKAANEPNRMFRHVDVDLADAEPFSVIAIPAWMGAIAADKKSYDDATSTYTITTAVPAALQHDLGVTSGTPFGLLDELATGFGAGAQVVVSAPLDATQMVALDSQGLFASATLLGKPLVNESVSFSDLNLVVSGTLDPKTLANGVITAKLANKVNLLDRIGDSTLIDVSVGENAAKSFKLPLPGIFGGPAGAALSLNADFKGAASRLDFDMSLSIDTATGMLVPDGTYFSFGAGGFAKLSAGAELSFDAIGFSIASLSVDGFVKVEAAIDVTARFGGSLLSPTVASVNSQAKARTTVGLDFTSSIFGFDTGNVTIDNGDLGINSQWRPLFGGSVPPNQFEQGANLLQQGASLQNGLPGVSPAQGSQFALLGSPSGGATSNASIRFTSPETGNVVRVGYDFQVLADTSSLTPGVHFLEAYLIGSEILLESIDLATLPLASSLNPFGFSSGWQSASGQPQAPLAAENSYQLEYRLISNSETENVAVAVDNLVLEKSTPEIDIRSSLDDVSDGSLRYVGESDGSDAPLALKNTGPVTATIAEILLDNPAFELIGAPQTGSILYSDDLPVEFLVRKVDPNTAGVATLTIVYADGETPTELTVVFTPTAVAWHNAGNRFDVDGDGEVRISDLLALVQFLRNNGLPTDLTSPDFASQAGPPYVDVLEDGLADVRDLLDLVTELRRTLTGGDGEGESSGLQRAGNERSQFPPDVQDETESYRLDLFDPDEWMLHDLCQSARTKHLLP